MESFLETLAYGSAAIFAVAVGVALWEHWRRQGRAVDLSPQAPPPSVAQVDFDLTMLDARLAATDQGQRQATVDAAMARMTRPAALAPSVLWIETRPMVAPGVNVEPETQ